MIDIFNLGLILVLVIILLITYSFLFETNQTTTDDTSKENYVLDKQVPKFPARAPERYHGTDQAEVIMPFDYENYTDTTDYSKYEIHYDEDRKSTRLNSSHVSESRMPSSA